MDKLEKKSYKNNKIFKFLIGIDEVGRGPIAGPVAVGAFIFLKPESVRLFKGIKESKQLTEEKRERWFTIIQMAQKEKHIDFIVTFQSEKIIDKKGISFAIKNALEISLKKVLKRNINLINNQESNKNCEIKPEEVQILLDGGLKAPAQYINQKTIIKGDEKEMVIALASICAKVTRDRYMRKIAKKNLEYGFDKHKGYGTKMHYEAISKYGQTTLHRRSFLKKFK